MRELINNQSKTDNHEEVSDKGKSRGKKPFTIRKNQLIREEEKIRLKI